jgi:glucose-1-phosphate thymidylyltransferase
MTQRKGIILAGGTGSRLWPITLAVSKQLLPIYDKPMIYYPLSVLMLAGIREIAIITTPEDQAQFKRLLSDGSQFGMSFTYIAQPRPDGLAQAYLLAEEFLAGSPSAMILGDNLFFGHGLPELLREASQNSSGGTIFGYKVADPRPYGIVEFDGDGRVIGLVEKPERSNSNMAITGLYFLDSNASAFARQIKPSKRGELEITDLLENYRRDLSLSSVKLGRGYAWLDTGTCATLLDAGIFVKTLEERQGLQMGSPEEISYNMGWISKRKLEDRAKIFGSNRYGQYLSELLNTKESKC